MTHLSPGELVACWLEENGLSQAWLSKKLGVARAQVWRWLSGQNQPPVDVCDEIERLTGGIVTVFMWAEQARATKRQRALLRAA